MHRRGGLSLAAVAALVLLASCVCEGNHVADFQGGSKGGGGVLSWGGAIGAAAGSALALGSGTEAIVATGSVIARFQMPRAGTLAGLFVRNLAAPGAGNGNTYVARVDGGDTLIQCTINGAVATTGSDNTNRVNVAVGSQVEIRVAVQAGAPADRTTRIDLGFE